MPPPGVGALVEQLFRHSAGQMVSRLACWLGAARLDLAEEAVQDALVRALSTWPFSGVPAEPRAWLFQVARNRALDLLRREASLRGKLSRFLFHAVRQLFLVRELEAFEEVRMPKVDRRFA